MLLTLLSVCKTNLIVTLLLATSGGHVTDLLSVPTTCLIATLIKLKLLIQILIWDLLLPSSRRKLTKVVNPKITGIIGLII